MKKILCIALVLIFAFGALAGCASGSKTKTVKAGTLTMSMSEEEVLGKAYDGRLMRRLLTYLRPYTALALLALLAIVSGAILELAPPYLMKLAIDRYIAAGDLAGLNLIAGFFFLVIVGAFAFEYPD
jgi:ATP-binding cassette subfamily B protein